MENNKLSVFLAFCGIIIMAAISISFFRNHASISKKKAEIHIDVNNPPKFNANNGCAYRLEIHSSAMGTFYLKHDENCPNFLTH
jgi:hypothetical protein